MASEAVVCHRPRAGMYRSGRVGNCDLHAYSMDTERTQAYRRVIDRIDDTIDSSVPELWGTEQECLRKAADNLLLSPRQLCWQELQEASSLLKRLVASGRWPQKAAEGLMSDLVACGPTPQAVDTVCERPSTADNGR